MNKIFKVKYSAIKNAMVVVSELANNKDKQSSTESNNASQPRQHGLKTRLSHLSMLIMLSLVSVHSAYAWEYIVIEDNGAVNSRNNKGAKNSINLSVGNGSTINSNSSGEGGVVIGHDAVNQMAGGVAVGQSSVNQMAGGVAVGQSSVNRVLGGVAIGQNAKTEKSSNDVQQGSVAIGQDSTAKGEQATALGQNAYSVSQAVSLGADTKALGVSSIAIGSDDVYKGGKAGGFADKLPEATIREIYADLIALDRDKFERTYIAEKNRVYSPTFSRGLGAIAMGSRTVAYGDGATSLGTLSFALADRSTAVGLRSYVDRHAVGATAIGENSRVFAGNSVSIGNITEAGSEGAMAYGYKAKAAGGNSLAIGSGVVAAGEFKNKAKETEIKNLYEGLHDLNGHTGLSAEEFNKKISAQFDETKYADLLQEVGRTGADKVDNDGNEYLDIGGNKVYKAKKGAENAIAIGNNTFGMKDNSLAIGYGTLSNAKNGIAVGSYTYVDGKNSMGLGVKTFVAGDNSIAQGYKATVRSGSDNAISFGNETLVGKDSSDSIVVGSSSKIYNGAKSSLIFGAGSVIGSDIDNNKIENAIVVGNKAKVVSNTSGDHETGKNAMAIGNESNASLENSMALGYQSKTDYTYKDLEKPAWVSKGAISIPTSGKTGVISVGSKGQERRIVNVASGANDTDAVNVAQLKTIEERFETEIDLLNGGGGVRYVSIDRAQSEGKAAKVEADIKREENYSKYVKLKSQLLYFTAREKLNGEKFNKETLKKLQAEVERLSETDSKISETTTELTRITNELEGKSVQEDADEYRKYLKEINDAEHTEREKLATFLANYGLTSDEIAKLKTRSNYDNLGAQGTDSIAIGFDAETTKADGQDTKDAKHGIAVGFGAKVKDESSISIGDEAVATAKNAVVIGHKAGNKDGSASTGEDIILLGRETTTTIDGAIAIGRKAEVAANAGSQPSIALGADSSVSEQASKTTELETTNLTFSDYKGDPSDYGTLSIGKAGGERTITNVAAGRVSNTSTDAINGSQLYATNKVLDNLASSVKTNFGGNAAITSKDGTVTFTNVGNTNKDTIHAAIALLADNTIALSGDTGNTESKKLKDQTISFGVKGSSDVGTAASGTDVTITLKKATSVTNNDEKVVTSKAVYNAIEGSKTTVTKKADAKYITVTPTENEGITANSYSIGLDEATLSKDYAKADASNIATNQAAWKTALGLDDLTPNIAYKAGKETDAKTVNSATGLTFTSKNADLLGITSKEGGVIEFEPKGYTKAEVDNKINGLSTTLNITGDDDSEGSVGLKEQKLAINGTAGEITTAASEQAVTVALSQAFKDKVDAKADKTALDELAKSVNGASGIDGVSGIDGAAGPGGKDGLNGASAAAKTQALRDGVAGPVVYTDADGNRLVKNGDEFVKASDVKDLKKANDGKYYPKEMVKADGTLEEGATPSTLAAVPTEKVQLSTVNPDGETKNPVSLANIKSGLGLTGAADNGDSGEAENPVAIEAEAAQKAIAGEDRDGKGGLLAQSGPSLNKAATVGDLQAIAQAGIDFLGNQDKDTEGAVIHKTLGSVLNIEGKKDEKYTDANKDNYSADNLITHNDEGTLRIEMLKTPRFEGLELAAEGGETISLTPDAEGKKLTLAGAGKSPDNKVVLDGLKAGEGADSAVTKGQLDKLAKVVGDTTAFKPVKGGEAPSTGTSTDDSSAGGSGSSTSNPKAPTSVGEAIDQLTTAVNKGLNFAGDTKNKDINRTLGSTLNIKGGANETKLTDNNIGVVSNGTDTLDVKLSENLTEMASFETKANTDGTKTKLDANGTTINGKDGKSANYTLEGATVKNKDGSATYGANKVTFKDKSDKELINIDATNNKVVVNGKDGKDGITINGDTKTITGVENRTIKKDDYGVGNNANNVATEGAVKDLADTIGIDTNSSGTSGIDGNQGAGGKDGLNGKSILDKLQALRDGVAGNTVYTDAKGNRLVKVEDGGKAVYYKPEDVVNGEAKDDAKPVNDVMISAVNSDGSTTAPTVLANIKTAVGTTDETSSFIDKLNDGVNPNTAATVGDLKNLADTGFKLQTNDGTENTVKAGNTVKVKDGVNTTVSKVEEKNGVFSYSINVNGMPMNYVDSDKKPLAKVGDKFYKLDGNGALLEENGKFVEAKPAGIALADPTNGNNPQTLSNVADGDLTDKSTNAVNGRQVAKIVGTDKHGNITKDIGGTGKDNISDAIKAVNSKANNPNPNFDTVGISKVPVDPNDPSKGTRPAVTMRATKDGALAVAGADGKSPVRITNVADPVQDTDATNKRYVDVQDRRLRGGIASAVATAGLPQAYLPGHSMVAVSGGTFDGESAVALGVSRISDSGKVIIKLSGSMNKQGKATGSVGVGYQW